MSKSFKVISYSIITLDVTITMCLSFIHLCIYLFSQLSPKANLTVTPSVKARSDMVTARSPSESPRIATAKSLLIEETKTETETETETKKEEAAMLSHFPTDATVKTVLVAV